MNKTVLGLAASVVFGTMFGAAPAAVAASENHDQEWRDYLLSQHVPADQVDELLAKMESGEVLDLYNPDVEPISVEKFEADGMKTIDVRYPDGSFSVSKAEVPVPASSDPSALAIEGCTMSSSGSWTVASNCIASWGVPGGTLQHRISARWIAGIQGAGQIDDVWGAQGGGIGYNAGSATVVVVRASGNPAISSARGSFSDPSGSVGVDRVGDVHVSRNGIEAQPVS